MATLSYCMSSYTQVVSWAQAQSRPNQNVLSLQANSPDFMHFQLSVALKNKEVFNMVNRHKEPKQVSLVESISCYHSYYWFKWLGMGAHVLRAFFQGRWTADLKHIF